MASPVELTQLTGTVSALAIGIWAVIKVRLSRSDTARREAADNDVNAGVGQREFIKILQAENGKWRITVDELHRERDEDHNVMDALRSELAVAQRALESALARSGAENLTRHRLSNDAPSVQRQVAEAGQDAYDLNEAQDDQ